ncbi:MAG: phasin family protein [Burkholderiaceae bacterium]|nr:phasin family protein [Burkholderiaceae bacterium]
MARRKRQNEAIAIKCVHRTKTFRRRSVMGLYPTPEDLSEAQKQNIDAMMKLSQKAFEGIEKMVELQLDAARSSLQETADKFQALMSVKDAADVVSLNKNIAAPNAEKALAYSRTIYDIASQTSSEVHRLVDAQIADANKKLIDALEEFSRTAPAGSEGVVAMMKSSLTAANSAYETANKAARQVVEMAERNMRAAAESGINASKR